ncbi:MAG: Ig-like domain-containing protein [Planctomycetota bacterium]
MPARSVGSRAARSRHCSVPFLLSLMLVAAASLSTSCGGGGGDLPRGEQTFRCEGDGADTLCLQSCSLGCSSTGCGRTEIAQNERLQLVFSENLDPTTVDNSSIVIRTANGAPAVGELVVVGNRVEFVPTVSVSGGQTFFGFTSGETYVLTIVGGENSARVVRGTSGRAFGRTLSCTLQSRLGIVDFDESPPVATLRSPIAASNVAPDALVELEFSELIDVTPFLGGGETPVKVTVRGTVDDGNGGLACDPGSTPEALPGSQFAQFDAARGVSVILFQPSQPLPPNACVEVEVTSAVTDLSGRSAIPAAFSFTTFAQPLTELPIVEAFTDQARFDADRSGGQWGQGELRFAAIGGDARHGAFELSLAGTPVVEGGIDTYTIDCDQTTVPASRTGTGSELTVTDGRFFFSEFVIPADVRVRFVGDSPARISVAGRIEVRGELDLSGGSVVAVSGFNDPAGQPGGRGGAGGGGGGDGGDQADGSGTGGGAFAGRDGDDVRLPAGHAYAGAAAGTGGRGSQLVPATGLDADRLFNPAASTFAVCLSTPAGGGGGSGASAGTAGAAQSNNIPDPVSGVAPWTEAFGPSAGPSPEPQLLPFPAGARSSEHYLLGGGGGGGSASNTMLSFNSSSVAQWSPGGGGGGGGGAVALRAGGSLLVTADGSIVARGGSTVDSTATGAAVQGVPGGGGGGGAIVLQSAGSNDVFGQLDVRGGLGGLYERGFLSPPNGAALSTRAGDGGAGLVRQEALAGTSATLQGTVQPAAARTVGELLERDLRVACQSTFYATGLPLPPRFVRYQIDALVDGQQLSFSDDPQVSPMMAGPGAPLRAVFQAATEDPATGAFAVVGPWRPRVGSTQFEPGVQSDQGNAVRFRVVVDRAFAQQVVVQRVTIVYEN